MAPLRRGARQFAAGATHEEAVETFQLWKKIGLASSAFCGVVFIYDFATEEHDHKDKYYPHERVRTKRFPWAAKDCDFFDLKCKARARGEVVEDHH